MKTATKVELAYRATRSVDDLTELMGLVFPGNESKAQRYAAACILIELREADRPVPNLAYLQQAKAISRRTFQRARAKLRRLGMIERVGFLNLRYHGAAGWRLSTRFSSSLRMLAQTFEGWAEDPKPTRCERDQALADLFLK